MSGLTRRLHDNADQIRRIKFGALYGKGETVIQLANPDGLISTLIEAESEITRLSAANAELLEALTQIAEWAETADSVEAASGLPRTAWIARTAIAKHEGADQ